ncbi:hypothetical protein [Bowmanella yangjiangensis]|uniref:Uncharacterized protein n=1 Tax=Bowmanella yangjiangensis TaxID=2811230 RepID=A0ABS3CQM5_9ALTE|nr:hypothetical protein [Bowmanella yangjiangensis]MBN7819408.1 hypothetical protein [Bowmanella yangjiangensis]
MDNLSRFYIELATDANKLNIFNTGNTAEELASNRRRLLSEAGVENAEQLLAMDSETLRQRMASALIASTGDWKGLENSSANSDNKDNIGRIGLTTH